MFCGKYDPKNAAMETGFTTTTELPLTLFCLCRNLCQRKADLAHLELFLFPTLKLAMKGRRFDNFKKNRKMHCRVQNTGLLQMF
jgi:hypothetical protein